MSDDVQTYNHESHWVSRVIETDWPFSITNPVLASIIWFGSVPNIFFVAMLTVFSGEVPQQYQIAIFFAVVWLNLGPFLIWYYDERVLPTFFHELSELIEDESRIFALSQKYDRLFAKRYWMPTVLWTALLVGLFFMSQSFLVSEGLFVIGGPAYFLLLLSVVWLGTFTGIGFMGVITTILAIKEISSEPLDISPLHPDGLGGLGLVGYYAIRTTITFSTGSLLLPLAFIFLQSSRFASLVYPIVGLYMGAIALSFFYPTYKINRRAKHIQEQTIDDLRVEYENAKRHMVSAGSLSKHLKRTTGKGSDMPKSNPIEQYQEGFPDTEELVGQLELQRIRNEYQDYQNVRLYPFQIDIILKLGSSILLPLVFLAVDQYLI